MYIEYIFGGEMLVAGVLCIVVNTVVNSLGSTYRKTYVCTILHIVVLVRGGLGLLYA